jgi:hypothetical protein
LLFPLFGCYAINKSICQTSLKGSLFSLITLCPLQIYTCQFITTIDFLWLFIGVSETVMASSIFNAPCTVPAVEGKNYFGLKPAVNNDLRFNVGKKTSIIGCPKRVFTVRASEKKDGPIKKLGLSDAECEAAVVAGNVPEAPPVPPRPAAPAGTPVVPSLVSSST